MMRIRSNVSVVGLGLAILFTLIAAPASASSSRSSTEAIDTVLAENPALDRRAGSPPLVSIDGSKMSVSVELRNDELLDLSMAELEGSEAVVQVVAMTRAVKNGRSQAATTLNGNRTSVEAGESGVTTVAEGLPDGLRIFEVIVGPASDHRFTYEIAIDGAQASFIVQEDGQIVVGSGSQREFVAVGAIETPWAYDAAGNPVPTRYQVHESGRKLTLIVGRSDQTRYPIVADPSFTSWAGEVHCSWGSCTFYLERLKTYWIRDTFAAQGFAIGSAVVGSALCSWVVAGTSFTGVGSFFVGLACAAYVASVMWDISHHADQGWSCLTMKKYHWETYPSLNSISHASGSNSHCHYNA